MICSVTSAKFPAHEAYFARTVMPLDITLYRIGIWSNKKLLRRRVNNKEGLFTFGLSGYHM